MNFGAPELIIVLLVVLLLFGGAKLPQLARSLGQAKKEDAAGYHARVQLARLDRGEPRPAA